MKLTKEQNMARLEAVANVTDWASVKLTKDGQIQQKYYAGKKYYVLAASTLGFSAALANIGYKVAALREKAQDARDGIKSLRSIIEQVNKEIKKEDKDGKEALRTLVNKVETSITNLVSYENKKRDALVGDDVEIDVETLLKEEEAKPVENTTQVEQAQSEHTTESTATAEPREQAATQATVEGAQDTSVAQSANGEAPGVPSASSPLIDSDDEDLVRQMLAQPQPARRGMTLRSGRTLAAEKV